MNRKRKRPHILGVKIASSTWPIDHYSDYCPPKSLKMEYDIERDGVLDEKLLFDPLELILDRQLQSITKIPHEDRGSRIHPIMRGEEGHHLNPFHEKVHKNFLPVNNTAQCILTLNRYKPILPDYELLVARLYDY